MYNDDEEKRSLPIRTFLVSLILIIIFVLLLVWLLPMPNLTGLNNRIFNSNIQEMKNAAIPYFTKDKLPQNEGDSVKMSLQEMIDAKIILPFTDKNGDYCDTQSSYILLTKMKEGYQLKTFLKCNDEENYILTNLGCYAYCESAVCEKETKTEEEKKKEDKPTPSVTPTVIPVTSDPSCTLVVQKGTKGENGWYLTDVTVGFGSKTGGVGSSLTEYGIGTSATYAKNTSFVVSSDGTVTVYGYVKNSNGKTNTCSITIKKDTVDPSCELGVLSGSKGADGTYTTNVEVGFTSKTDATSGVNAYGVTNSNQQTFNGNTSYTVTTNGTHKIYGYVKDAAGHVRVCNLTVKRNAGSTPTPHTSSPSCSLKVTSGTAGANGWYVSDVVIGFASKGTNGGASVTGFGIGTSETYGGNTSYTINKDGSMTVYGYVKDSYGNTGTCSTTVKRDATKPNCELTVTSGTKSGSVYNSNIVIGFKSKSDATSGMNSFGIGKSTTYSGNTSFTLTEVGKHTVYGYVKDNAGNTNTCNITVERAKSSNPTCSLKVTSGTVGTNGWYISDVVVGFASKGTTGGASVTGYGIGTSPTYGNNTSYTINKDGSMTVYGYVKDSYGATGTCSTTIKRDATKPTCSLKVTSGTYNSNGYYTSDIVIGWNNKNDVTSGMAAYGIGKSTTYDGSTSYKITAVGKHTVYGYVKDKAGNTNNCSITVEKRGNVEYRYEKKIGTQYSAWTDWSKLTYNPSNPPKFGKYALIEMEDLGKVSEVDHYTYSTGNPIYQTVKVKVGTVTGTYCTDYEYYRITTTTSTTTYAVKYGDGWTYVGRVTRTSAPTDTMTTRYEFVGLDWSECGTGCTRAPKQIWNKFTRTAYIASSTDTVTTNDGVKVKCAKTGTRTVTIYSNVNQIAGYEQVRTPVYKDVYYYKRRTRTVTQEAYTDYKWSYYNNQNLISQGYVMNPNVTRVVN